MVKITEQKKCVFSLFSLLGSYFYYASVCAWYFFYLYTHRVCIRYYECFILFYY